MPTLAITELQPTVGTTITLTGDLEITGSITGDGIVNGHIIEEDGTPLDNQNVLNFVGAGVIATDSGGKTVVTVTNTGHIIENEGSSFTQQDTLNFEGTGIDAVDSGGKTVITLPGSGKIPIGDTLGKLGRGHQDPFLAQSLGLPLVVALNRSITLPAAANPSKVFYADGFIWVKENSGFSRLHKIDINNNIITTNADCAGKATPSSSIV